MSKHDRPFDPSKPVVLGGPRTEAGREISSRNAMKHGCCSTETLILPWRESMEDFKALEQNWLQAYSPRNESERHLVQDVVLADWFFQRATRTLAEVEHKSFVDHPDPIDWDEDVHRKLARFQRYQTTRANLLAKCRKAFEEYRKSRASERQTEERHELYKEKNKPEPTIQEILHGMLQQKQEREGKERLNQTDSSQFIPQPTKPSPRT